MWQGADFAVTANEEPAFTGIDAEAGERIDFDLLLGRK